jgi:hypothetical protein
VNNGKKEKKHRRPRIKRVENITMKGRKEKHIK